MTWCFMIGVLEILEKRETRKGRLFLAKRGNFFIFWLPAYIWVKSYVEVRFTNSYL